MTKHRNPKESREAIRARHERERKKREELRVKVAVRLERAKERAKAKAKARDAAPGAQAPGILQLLGAPGQRRVP